MPDRWTLVTPQGDYVLNASFSAPRLHPGGVDTGAALRRDGHRAYQRSGDGLRTPGPLLLKGRVWRDDQDVAAIVDELDDITDAVAAAIAVRRENSAGSYTYRDLAGGPVPAMTPDGLGGWEVEIELWPGRATPTFLPVRGDTHVHVYVDGSSGMDNDRAAILEAMSDLKDLLGEEIFGDDVNSRVTITTTPDNDFDAERWLFFGAQPTEADVVAIAIFNEAEPRYHTVPRVVGNEPTSYFLEDYDAWRAKFASASFRRLLLYAIEFDPAWEAAFNGHVQDALSGANGYPSDPPLAQLGVSASLSVPTGQTADVYFQDILTALGG